MAATATAQEIKKLKQGFPQQALLCLAAIAAIHILPKSHEDTTFRLLLTVAYFGAAIILLLLIDGPRAKYMKRTYELKYADGGPALEQTYRLYLSALGRFCRMVSLLMLAFVCANAIRVLTAWMPAFIILAPIAAVAWWGSVAAILFFPMWGRSYVSDVMQKRRLLQESIETGDFQPHDIDAIAAAGVKPDQPPVVLDGDHAFTAGGFKWKWDDFYKNCIVFGMTGTGKTVCVLNALLDGLLLSDRDANEHCSGLMLDPKGDFVTKLRTICRHYGREEDIVTINPDSKHGIHWNPLDCEDDELEVAARFAAALEASTGMKSGGGDSFWLDSAQKFIRHAVRLLRITNPEGQPPTFAQIGELASSMKRVSEVADLVADDNPEGDQCLAFFADEWSALADQTRSSIQAYITNMIDPFLMTPYATVFSGRSTIRITDIVDSGKILYVYMPIADKERMSKVICTFVKMEFQRVILNRRDKTRCSFFFCDEFQSYFTPMPGKGDADFFERSRQSLHVNIIATQNYPALAKMAGDKESVVNNLLGNCAVKIFLRNTDDKTNEYASKLFGQKLVAMASSNLSQGVGKSVGNAGASSNRQYDQKVRPEEFIDLAIPTGGDDSFAETIVHLAARATVTKEKLQWRAHPLKK